MDVHQHKDLCACVCVPELHNLQRLMDALITVNKALMCNQSLQALAHLTQFIQKKSAILIHGKYYILTIIYASFHQLPVQSCMFFLTFKALSYNPWTTILPSGPRNSNSVSVSKSGPLHLIHVLSLVTFKAQLKLTVLFILFYYFRAYSCPGINLHQFAKSKGHSTSNLTFRDKSSFLNSLGGV